MDAYHVIVSFLYPLSPEIKFKRYHFLTSIAEHVHLTMRGKTNITNFIVEAVKERDEEEEEKDKEESQDLFLNFRNSELRSKLKEQKSIN